MLSGFDQFNDFIERTGTPVNISLDNLPTCSRASYADVGEKIFRSIKRGTLAIQLKQLEQVDTSTLRALGIVEVGEAEANAIFLARRVDFQLGEEPIEAEGGQEELGDNFRIWLVLSPEFPEPIDLCLSKRLDGSHIFAPFILHCSGEAVGDNSFLAKVMPGNSFAATVTVLRLTHLIVSTLLPADFRGRGEQSDDSDRNFFFVLLIEQLDSDALDLLDACSGVYR